MDGRVGMRGQIVDGEVPHSLGFAFFSASVISPSVNRYLRSCSSTSLSLRRSGHNGDRFAADLDVTIEGALSVYGK